MADAKKICVVTGSRAEYGLLSLLMHEIAADDRFHLQLVVTGTHLSPRFGETWRDIESDGFRLDAKVVLDLDDDAPVSIARAMGQALAGLADAYQKLAPDLVVLLGDRYETLAAAEAATVLRIPVAHIHGGEITEGAFDDAIRHAVTKLSALHFVACEEFARRVVQLGEQPQHVFTVGALGVDAIRRIELLSRAELEADLGIDLKEPVVMITYHPATLGKLTPAAAADALLSALAKCGPATMVFSGVNADPGGNAISARIHEFVRANPKRAVVRDNFGQRCYLSLVALSSAVVGNSSSGLIEAPALKTATVNIGDRQKGRPCAASVIDCGETEAEISAALARALSGKFQASLDSVVSVYGEGSTSQRIVSILRSLDFTDLTRKRFRDLPQVA